MGLEGHLDWFDCSSSSLSPALADTSQKTVSSSLHCLLEMLSQQAGGTPYSGPAITHFSCVLVHVPVPHWPSTPCIGVCTPARKQLISWTQPWLNPVPSKKRCSSSHSTATVELPGLGAGGAHPVRMVLDEVQQPSGK